MSRLRRRPWGLMGRRLAGSRPPGSGARTIDGVPRRALTRPPRAKRKVASGEERKRKGPAIASQIGDAQPHAASGIGSM